MAVHADDLPVGVWRGMREVVADEAVGAEDEDFFHGDGLGRRAGCGVAGGSGAIVSAVASTLAAPVASNSYRRPSAAGPATPSAKKKPSIR